MNDIQKNTTFQYTYSANEQEELKRIRSKYAPKEENKMDLLRRLDAQVYQKATMYAIIVGVIMAFIAGYVSIRFFMKLISRVSLNGFAIYVTALGILVIILQLTGVMTDAAPVQQAVQGIGAFLG